jgi:starvation-inducible DNA-binding protein
MAQAYVSIEIAVPPDEAWKLIGGFGSLPDWLPYIPKANCATAAASGTLQIPVARASRSGLRNWHMSGPHFRDYHLLLDEHGDQLFAMTDDIAERARKIGGTRVRFVGHIARVKRIADNDAEYVTPKDMLSELWQDNKALILSMRSAHNLCDEAGDVASASLLENWIDETQRRAWFLFETART